MMYKIHKPWNNEIGNVGETIEDNYGAKESALYAAVKHTAVYGEDCVVSNALEELFYIEADTKVEDDAPTFPVIVHILALTDGPALGLQC